MPGGSTRWRTTGINWKLAAFVGEARRPYQHTGVDFFLQPAEILSLVEAAPGTVVFCGSGSSLGGGFDFDRVFTGRLHDPVLKGLPAHRSTVRTASASCGSCPACSPR